MLEQADDGTLMLGPRGERLTDSYEFFAVFKSPEEYRIECSGRTLGTIALKTPLGLKTMSFFQGGAGK